MAKRWTMNQMDELVEAKLQEGVLTPEELHRFDSPPRRTVSEYRENMLQNVEVLCRITGCRQIGSLKQNIDEIMSDLLELEGEDRPHPLTPGEIKKCTTERGRRFKESGFRRIKRFRRKSMCHYGFRYFLVCYCDEQE